MKDRHAVFATCQLGSETVTFRIGQPVDWDRAQARWSRLYPAANGIRGRVRHSRRWYRPSFMEVRSVDRHGRGLGSERHETAIPVPYRAIRKVR
jgi:hypothetical protein